MRTHLLKRGKSLVIRIPKAIADEAKLKTGDPIEIEVASQGCVQLRRAGKIPALIELISQITGENRNPEILAGPEVGKETIEW